VNVLVVIRTGVNGIQGPSAYPLWQWFCQNGKTGGMVDNRRQSFSLADRDKVRIRPDCDIAARPNILRNTKYPTVSYTVTSLNQHN
jgi:hypothetical protein